MTAEAQRQTPKGRLSEHGLVASWNGYLKRAKHVAKKLKARQTGIERSCAELAYTMICRWIAFEASRPSVMPQTTKDWPRRQSPAAKTLGLEVRKASGCVPKAARKLPRSVCTPNCSPSGPSGPRKPRARSTRSASSTRCEPATSLICMRPSLLPLQVNDPDASDISLGVPDELLGVHAEDP